MMMVLEYGSANKLTKSAKCVKLMIDEAETVNGKCQSFFLTLPSLCFVSLYLLFTYFKKLLQFFHLTAEPFRILSIS